MELKCKEFVKGGSKTRFTKGMKYDVVDYDSDGDYIVIDDNYKDIVVCKDTLATAYFNNQTYANFEIAKYHETPEEPTKTNKKISLDSLEFGQVIHVDETPYAFIKHTSGGCLYAFNQEGVKNLIDSCFVDEFKPNPQEQRRQQFLNLWQSQGIDYADDHLYSEMVGYWGVEGLFKFIEKHSERIVEIFGE